MHTFHQGDINFIPLEAFGKSAADVDRSQRLRAHDKRLLIQEGEITGHHHGVWFVPQPVMFRDDGLARDMAATSAVNVSAQLFADAKLQAALGLDDRAPVIGFLIAETDVVVRHASEAGVATHEHSDIAFVDLPPECKSPSGGYLVTGKREWSAGDERRVED